MQREVTEQSLHCEPALEASDEEQNNDETKNTNENRRTQTSKEIKALYNLTYEGTETIDSSIKTIPEDKNEFLRQIVLKIIETAMKKSCVAAECLYSSPIGTLLDDSCPEVHLYKNSAFTREEIKKVEEPKKKKSLLTEMMKKVTPRT